MEEKYWQRSVCRRRSLVVAEKAKPKLKTLSRLKEAAGEAAAECAAVTCCCPCGVVNLLVVTMIKLPVRLVRRALRQMKAKDVGQWGWRRKGDDEGDCSIRGGCGFVWAGTAAKEEEAWSAKTTSPEEEEMKELEKQMVALFGGAGFWRSPSQNESCCSLL